MYSCAVAAWVAATVMGKYKHEECVKITFVYICVYVCVCVHMYECVCVWFPFTLDRDFPSVFSLQRGLSACVPAECKPLTVSAGNFSHPLLSTFQTSFSSTSLMLRLSDDSFSSFTQTMAFNVFRNMWDRDLSYSLNTMHRENEIQHL